LREADDRPQENITPGIAETVEDQPQDDAAAAFRQKEEFLAIMSHEILTPINELAGKVSLLLDSPLNPGQREHAKTIQRCAQDLLALLNDMDEFMAGRRQETRAGGLQ
jgi:signal transduction histidine kinase